VAAPHPPLVSFPHPDVDKDEDPGSFGIASFNRELPAIRPVADLRFRPREAQRVWAVPMTRVPQGGGGIPVTWYLMEALLPRPVKWPVSLTL